MALVRTERDVGVDDDPHTLWVLWQRHKERREARFEVLTVRGRLLSLPKPPRALERAVLPGRGPLPRRSHKVRTKGAGQHFQSRQRVRTWAEWHAGRSVLAAFRRTWVHTRQGKCDGTRQISRGCHDTGAAAMNLWLVLCVGSNRSSRCKIRTERAAAVFTG